MNNFSDLSPVKQLDTETAPKGCIFSDRLPNASLSPRHKSHQHSHISINFNKNPHIDKNVPLSEIASKKHKLSEGIKKQRNFTPPPESELIQEYLKLNGAPEIYIGDKIGYDPELCVKKTSAAVSRPTKSEAPSKYYQEGGDSKRLTFWYQSADETPTSQFPKKDSFQNKVECSRLKDVSTKEEETTTYSDQDTFKTADTHFSFDKTSASQSCKRHNLWETVYPLTLFQHPSPTNLRTSHPSDQSFDNDSSVSLLFKGLRKLWYVNPSDKSIEVSPSKRGIQQQITSNQSDHSSENPNDPCTNPFEPTSLLNRHLYPSYSNPSVEQSSDAASGDDFWRSRKWPVVELGSNRNYIRALAHRDDGILRTDVIEAAMGKRLHWTVNYDNVNYIRSFMSPHPRENAFRIR